jgi:hypothetical protein
VKKPYQDIWRNGRLITPGRRDCAGRYEVIRAALESELGRGFSVADVGGWDGYFPVRLAEDLSAHAENIDSRDIPLACHRRLNVTAKTVGEVGYHDAILCLSVLHHMEDWREVYEGLKAQCLVLICEVCHRVADIFETVSADADALLCETPCLDNPRNQRPMFLVRSGVKGTVEPGTGKAAALMAETDDVDWAELGYVPVPGTLNVAVPAAGADWLKSLPGVDAPGLRRSRHYVPVRVGDIEGHVHFARSPKSRPEKVIELVAPVSFREAGYSDGAQIVVVAR